MKVELRSKYYFSCILILQWIYHDVDVNCVEYYIMLIEFVCRMRTIKYLNDIISMLKHENSNS